MEPPVTIRRTSPVLTISREGLLFTGDTSTSRVRSNWCALFQPNLQRPCGSETGRVIRLETWGGELFLISRVHRSMMFSFSFWQSTIITITVHIYTSIPTSSFGGITRLVIYRWVVFPRPRNSGSSGAHVRDGWYSSNMDVVLGTFLMLFSLDGFRTFGCGTLSGILSLRIFSMTKFCSRHLVFRQWLHVWHDLIPCMFLSVPMNSLVYIMTCRSGCDMVHLAVYVVFPSVVFHVLVSSSVVSFSVLLSSFRFLRFFIHFDLV